MFMLSHILSLLLHFFYLIGKPFNNWRVVHSKGNLAYRNQTGAVIINVPGVYYIYSHLQLVGRGNSHVSFWKHATYVNNKQVLCSTVSHKPQRLKYKSNYQGGIFPLQKGDRVFIGGLPYRETYPEYNYFGLFRLSH